jgi:hypothetical protein
MPESPEYSAVYAPEDHCSEIGVLIEIGPARDFAVDAFHDIHPIPTVISR